MLNLEFPWYSFHWDSCFIEQIKFIFSISVSDKLCKIKSINGSPFIVNRALGIPSDKGLSLVASPPTNNRCL